MFYSYLICDHAFSRSRFFVAKTLILAVLTGYGGPPDPPQRLRMSNFSLDDPDFNPYSQLTSLSHSLFAEADSTLPSVDDLSFVDAYTSTEVPSLIHSHLQSQRHRRHPTLISNPTLTPILIRTNTTEHIDTSSCKQSLCQIPCCLAYHQ